MLELFRTYASKGEDVIRTAIQPLRATGQTERSIHSEVREDGFTIFARGFFSNLETGRGPRKSTAKGEFESNMLAYMSARGIGSGLTDKKKKQLARFLTWKINKDGDKTFKKGGRMIYSDALNKFIIELTEAVKKEWVGEVIAEIKTITR